MSKMSFLSIEFLPTFQNKDDYFDKIMQEKNLSGRVLSLLIMLNIFSFLYGIVMGSFHSLSQALATGAKVAALFDLTILICFPAFFIIQFVLGSKLKLGQMVSIILSGFVLSASIMVSFAPIIIFFLLTGSNYYFLQLLHIAIFVLSGLFGMKNVIAALKISCEKRNVYPRTGVIVFRFWVVIMVFVGIQLAWNLRPFLGDEGKPFKLFRHYEGNFYTALIYTFGQLSGKKEIKKEINNHNPKWEEIEIDSSILDMFKGEEEGR